MSRGDQWWKRGIVKRGTVAETEVRKIMESRRFLARETNCMMGCGAEGRWRGGVFPRETNVGCRNSDGIWNFLLTFFQGEILSALTVERSEMVTSSSSSPSLKWSLDLRLLLEEFTSGRLSLLIVIITLTINILRGWGWCFVPLLGFVNIARPASLRLGVGFALDTLYTPSVPYTCLVLLWEWTEKNFSSSVNFYCLAMSGFLRLFLILTKKWFFCIFTKTIHSFRQ